MGGELLLPFVAFAVVVTITPGPNNIMLTASGANFGFVRTVPHLLGISVGFPVMVMTVGLGLGSVFDAYPIVHTVLKVLGGLYMLWLAYRIATASAQSAAVRRGRPFSFLQAAMFQWVNPKAWIIAVGAMSAFTTLDRNIYVQVLTIALIFATVAVPCCSLWTALGVVISRVLASARTLRLFNLAMGLLLAASILWIFVD